MLPETRFLWQAFVVQSILILLTIPFPFLMDLTVPTITASILLMPLVIYLYGRALLLIGMAATQSITDELKNDTLNILRATPFSLNEIIGSKAAAAVWRQVEDLGLLLVAAALMSTPVLISYYAGMWSLDEYPLVTRSAVILGLAVSILRMMIEPMMVALVGVAMGATFKTRAAGVVAMIICGGFYFLLVNLSRFIPVEWPLKFLLDFALPIVLPFVVMGGALWLARYLLERS